MSIKSKFFSALGLLLVCLSLPGALLAQEGELEIFGHVTTVSAWQRTHGSSAVATGAGDGLLNDGLRAPGAAQVDQFGFYADEVEIDLEKQFGENIRLRADLDFNPTGTRVGYAGVGGVLGLEQAFVTVNVPLGNGAELLFGRFNSNIGLDPIDRNGLSTISYATTHRRFLPHNITGMDLYYGVSERWSFNVFVVNDLRDAVPGTSSEIPSFGFLVNYTTGEFGEASWVRFSGAGGPEQRTKKNWSLLGNLAASVNVSDGFFVDAEGMYRQDNSGGADNAQYLAGTLQARYAFSDIWDGTIRYGFAWDLDQGQSAAVPAGGIVPANPLAAASGLGYAGQQHDISLAAGYAITDGARFVLEGRYDLSKASAGGTSHVYGVGGGFYYDF